jgi:hypothetical protein
MINEHQAKEILRLALMLSMKRVRYYAVRHGTTRGNETLKGTESGARKAQTDLKRFVSSITKPASSPQFEADS